MSKINWRLVVELVIGALLLLALVSWVQAREGRIRAEATAEAQGKVQKDLIGQMTTLANTVKQMHDEQAAKLAAVDAKFSRATTPQDVAKIAEQVMALNQPIKFVTPPATIENPNPQPIAQVSVEDTPKVKEYLKACEECKVNLETKTHDLTYAQQQQELQKQQLSSVTLERDEWKKASKGTFWSNAKRAGKWGLIGGGVTLIVACSLGHCPR